MYDTVGFVIPHDGLDRILNRLGTLIYESPLDISSPYTYRGKYRNMRINLGEEFVALWGSIGKFAHGNNLSEMTTSDVDGVLGELSDLLQLPVSQATVVRFDAGINVAVEKPVAQYLQVLGDMTRYKRRSHGRETVAYDLKCRTIHFYDKLAEMRYKKVKIPASLPSEYILRYEVQWKKEVERQWKKPVKASMLACDSFMARVANWMETELDRIPKLDGQFASSFDNWSSLRDQLVFGGIQYYGGFNGLLNQAKGNREAGILSPVNLSRIRSQLQRHISDPGVIEPSPLAEELERKVKAKLACFR